MPARLPVTRKRSYNVFLQTSDCLGTSLGLLRFRSVVPAAFRSSRDENFGTTGQGYTGTRLKAAFNNIPHGVRLFVATNNAPNAANARLITAELGPYQEARATKSFDGIATAELTIVNGSATAVWEVITGRTLTPDALDFPAFIEYEGQPELNVPAVGTGTVNGSFAPTPPMMKLVEAAVASPTLPFPAL